MNPDLPAVINEVLSPRLAKDGITFTFDRGVTGYGYDLRLTSGEIITNHHMPDESLGYVYAVEDLHYYVNTFLTEAVKIHKDAVDDAKEKPLFTEAVVGFRTFKLADWVLGPLNYGYPWRPGENTAQCLPNEATLWGRGGARGTLTHDKPPHKDCHCGLNAFFEPQDMKEGGDVIAAVIGWGDMRVHPDGWRAEKARIVALLNNSLNLDEVARLYNVPIVVDMEALQMKASEFGTPLPKSLRPKEQETTAGMLSTALKASWTSTNVTTQFMSGGYTSAFYTQPRNHGYVQMGTGGTLPAPQNPYSGVYAAKRKEYLKREAAALKRAQAYKQSKYGPAVSHGMRMEEMMEKVKQINARNDDLKKALNPPNPKKKPWRINRKNG